MAFGDRFRSTFDFHDGIFYKKGAASAGIFENEYIRLREKEGRVYSDAVVSSLPEIDGHHPQSTEWRLRKTSAVKLISYLRKRHKTKSLLEIGCGNGWLSHALASSLTADVCALDINEVELRQGARIFQRPELVFVYADIFTVSFNGFKFDTIILASSIQYFYDLPKLIKRLLEMITPDGKILVLDSPWYTSKSAAAARERSKAYFESMGVPEMAENYFHHTLSELAPFNCQVLFKPNSLVSIIKRKVFGKRLPYFPWIEIKGF